MIGNCDKKKIIKQSLFCLDLMKRLDDTITSSGAGTWSGLENHCRTQDDIKRLRRELMTLSKMLNPWG